MSERPESARAQAHLCNTPRPLAPHHVLRGVHQHPAQVRHRDRRLLRVVVPDIDAYDAFYKKLIASAKLKDVSSTFAIEQIKSTSKLPVTIAD